MLRSKGIMLYVYGVANKYSIHVGESDILTKVSLDDLQKSCMTAGIFATSIQHATTSVLIDMAPI